MITWRLAQASFTPTQAMRDTMFDSLAASERHMAAMAMRMLWEDDVPAIDGIGGVSSEMAWLTWAQATEA